MIPYRIDIAGTWGDHPFINAIYPQDVICVSVDGKFKKGMGLSGSTREVIIKNSRYTMKTLFEIENKGKKFMSGSQDLLGIFLPGLKKLKYKENYWPENNYLYITADKLKWLERVLYLVPTKKRPKDLNVLGELRLTKKKAKIYAKSTKKVWKAIINKDIKALGKEITNNHNILMSMMPRRDVNFNIKSVKNSYGYKLCGAGGGGYLLVVSNKKVKGGIKFKIV